MSAPTQDPFVASLLQRITADPAVVGLVLVGSSADVARRDAWSDHDFLMIVESGRQESYRTDLSWLPNAEDIGLWFRETAHGLKVLYRSGLLLEFAVFDRDEFAACAVNHFAVALDRGGITELAEQVHGRTVSTTPIDRLQQFRFFLSLVYVGVGRARRGEVLSGGVFVRTYAAERLLRLLTDTLVTTDRAPLDVLDPWRRFEQVWPEVGAAVAAALALPVEAAAQALLEVAEAHLPAGWPDYPADDTALVRELLDW